MGPYSENIKNLENDNKELLKTINKKLGVRESDTGLSLPS